MNSVSPVVRRLVVLLALVVLALVLRVEAKGSESGSSSPNAGLERKTSAVHGAARVYEAADVGIYSKRSIAADHHGSVDFRGRIQAPGLSTSDPLVSVKLNNGERVAVVRGDGSFVIPALKDGEYRVEIQTTSQMFPAYSLRVEKQKQHVSFLDAKGKPKYLSPPFRFEPAGKPNYFMKRNSMNLLGMFMSPQILLMLFTVVVLFVLPKMISPEDMAKMQEEQKKSGAGAPPNQEEIMQMLPTFLGGKGGKSGNDSDSD